MDVLAQHHGCTKTYGLLGNCRAKAMPYIASMGIYVLKASAIKKLLTDHFPEVCVFTTT